MNGKIALVTGASAGIGAAIARALAKAGAPVAVHYRSGQQGAEALVAEIEAGGGQAAAFGGDVADPAAAAALVAAVVQRFGRIDILVNNAGIIEPGAFGAITPASFERQFRVNALSVLLMMQEAAPHMPDGGRVINISSTLAMAPIANAAAYSASKAAVHALTQAFARELGGRAVTVNAIAPGATETAMTAALDRAIKDRISAMTPLGRWARPEDIADVALFLASDAARFITGRIMAVDGGLIA
jgi:3-oxoacyl-[acyl-carrier protein] reductase